MNWRGLIIIFAVLLQLAIAFIPMLPGLKTLLPQEPTQREQLEWTLQVIGFNFAVLTACIAIMFVLQERKHDKFENRLSSLLPQTRVEQLRDDDFYVDFLHSARRAEHQVSIMYLSPRSPKDTNNPDRLEYYGEIGKVIRKCSSVRFARIVRTTNHTKDWIAGLLRELTGCPNAFIAVFKDTNEENPLALSVQVVDSTKVWLVALSSHERKGAFRDLSIENPVIAESFQMYFDRIYESRCDELMNAGRITPEGNKFLEAFSS